MKRALEVAQKHWTELKASDVMKAPVVSLNEGLVLREAARVLSDEHIGGAPVVDHRGAPVGVVSLFDIVSNLAGLERLPGEPGGFYRQGKLRFVEPLEDPEAEASEEGTTDETTVAEIMAPGLIGVPTTASFGEVVQLLQEKQIHRVFVLDAHQHLAGVISTMDILRVIAGKEA